MKKVRNPDSPGYLYPGFGGRLGQTKWACDESDITTAFLGPDTTSCRFCPINLQTTLGSNKK